jgi:hypothetical protein
VMSKLKILELAAMTNRKGHMYGQCSKLWIMSDEETMGWLIWDVCQ